jgi:2-polyprenyl-3-methyl-5-hydroxy-6-metoxy-1,4-benzoquinol methylase
MLSDTYRKQLEQLHADQKLRWGNDGKFHRARVAELAKQVEAKTLLDFGCGRSSLAKALKFYGSKLRISEYDPGRPKKATLPRGPFDMVVCTDVMEHVETDQVGTVIGAIAARTTKRAFFVIDCIEANQLLPDGRNAHLTVRPPQWWEYQVLVTFGIKYNYDLRVHPSGKKLDIVVTRG